MTVETPSSLLSSSTILHTLDSSSPTSSIGPVLKLSNQIFDTASTSPTHHSSLEEWCRRLNNENSIVVYSTFDDVSSSTTTPPVPIDCTSTDGTHAAPAAAAAVVVTGFVFAHMKTDDAALPFPTLHIWLAGVSDKARGTGVFATLMGKVETHARSKGVKALSVATFPDKYGKMYAILQKQGWEAQDWSDDGRKVLMMRTI